MRRERSPDRALGEQDSTDLPGSQPIGPGKRTRVEGLAVQRRAAAGPSGTELAAGTGAEATALLMITEDRTSRTRCC
jgi:hypothetical protein